MQKIQHLSQKILDFLIYEVANSGYITGRIKNLIILSNGKNVSPEELESKIKKIAGAEEVLVYAKNGHLCAEIYPNFGGAKKESDVKYYFENEIDLLNQKMPSYKAVEEVIIRENPFKKPATNKIIRKRSI